MPAHEATVGTGVPGIPSAPTARRLVVTWQHPMTRSIEPIGFLSYDGGPYGFAYIRHALDVAEFRPLLGFEDLYYRYTSDVLFPLFAQRVMDPRRPDYQRYVQRLGLPDDASPWEQITRSQGRRQGDTLQLLPEPTVFDGQLSCMFLVHGIRHISERDLALEGVNLHVTGAEVETALSSLRPGDPLHLMPEPRNPHNPLALLVAATSLTPVGWVPNVLVEDLNRLIQRTVVHVTAAHINGPDAPWHLRLLASLLAPEAGNFRFFTDRRWETLADADQ
jgi:hypothetical protein